MDPDQRSFDPRHIAHRVGKVFFAIEQRTVRMSFELAISGRDDGAGEVFDEFLPATAIADQVGD